MNPETSAQKARLNELIAELKSEINQRKLNEDKLNRVYWRVLFGAVAVAFGLAILTVTAVEFAWRAQEEKTNSQLLEELQECQREIKR
ncbi:MAG: hypothetical protein ACHBN1_13435 [Heteroscytonema crispum UTEX LB 1556]